MNYIGYVYIPHCSNGKYYTGNTTDLQKRLVEHEEGIGANFTRKYLPFKLVYVETFKTVDQAFAREKQIQSWSRKKKEALNEASKSINEKQFFDQASIRKS